MRFLHDAQRRAVFANLGKNQFATTTFRKVAYKYTHHLPMNTDELDMFGLMKRKPFTIPKDYKRTMVGMLQKKVEPEKWGTELREKITPLTEEQLAERLAEIDEYEEEAEADAVQE